MKHDREPPREIVDKLLAAVGGVGDDVDLIDLRVGAFWVGVRTTVGTGMASTLRSEDHLHGSRPIAAAGELDRWRPADVAELLRSPSVPEASIGLAAVNAILQPEAVVLPEEQASAVLAREGRKARVAMVGRFPFAEHLKASVGRLDVFERGRNQGIGDRDEDAMDELIPVADVVAVTATTLINGTIAEVLRHVRRDAFLMMLGPSTPLTPSLFEFGFDVLCGTVVDDGDAAMRAIGQGAVTSQIPGVRRVALWSPRG